MNKTIGYTVENGSQTWQIEVVNIIDNDSNAEVNKCECCLNKSDSSQSIYLNCSLIKELYRYGDRFSELASFDEISVSVSIDEVKTVTTTTAQQFLSSLAGLIIALNQECSATKILYPMAVFHRPFMSFEESIYRSLANAGLIYFQSSSEQSYEDFVSRNYKNLQLVNKSLIRHLQADHADWEALVNAIVNLDLFVKAVLFNVKNSYPDIPTLNRFQF